MADARKRFEKAYLELTPLLLAVLRRLARQGFIVDFGQVPDHIHDFFADAWPQLERRYDPTKGSMRTYAAAAFTRYVRPRLVREARWVRSLQEGLHDAVAVEGHQDDLMDVHNVRQALASLGRSDRAILGERFAQGRPSERQLALRHGVSRYRLRETVATALARLAAAMGERGTMKPGEFDVARLIFAEGKSIQATAAQLSWTEAQVRLAKRRIILALGRASTEQ